MEVFKDIAGYEGLYQVSNLGRVRSIARNTTSGRFLKPATDGRGYQFVHFSKDGKHKMFKVHRLVASAFLPKPLDTNATEVNHKDENKANNIIALNFDGSVNVEQSNLEWCTKEYNNNYGTRIERISKAISKPVLQFTKSGEFVKEWQSTHEVQRVLGIANQNIGKCCLGKLHTSGGYIWRYA
ncbi:MAG: NUMOD4 domain-containing protein [bacterium]|nr:NUMOD4 domain-containing protein [bacterium]